jgi:hypothetical protein
VSDQVPPDGNIDSGHLLQRFLDLVFADVVQARIISRACGGRPVSLGDCHDHHPLPVTAPSYGFVNSGSHVGHTLIEAGESHNR